MKTLIPLALLVFISSLTTFGQIGIDNSSPDPSSVLDLSSTEGGLLVPRMTTQQREAIESPANSLLVFDTSENKYFYYDNNKWNPVSPWSPSASGADVYYETGNVGIGTASPQYKLDVDGQVNATALHINGTPLSADISPMLNGSLAKDANDRGDWNLVNDPGFWVGNNLLNQPTGNGIHAWKYVTVIKHNDLFSIQTATDFNNIATYQRVKISNTWQAWKRIVYFDDNGLIKSSDGGEFASIRLTTGNIRIHEKRAIVGFSNHNQLHINYDNDFSQGVNSFGNFHATGNISQSSDIRLKDNIEPIVNALDKVMNINGVTFTRKDQEDKKKVHIGVIADQLLNVVPELVTVPEDVNEMKGVNYSQMTALLIEAIKEQQIQAEDLKRQVEELRQEIEVLKEH